MDFIDGGFTELGIMFVLRDRSITCERTSRTF